MPYVEQWTPKIIKRSSLLNNPKRPLCLLACRIITNCPNTCSPGGEAIRILGWGKKGSNKVDGVDMFYVNLYNLFHFDFIICGPGNHACHKVIIFLSRTNDEGAIL